MTSKPSPLTGTLWRVNKILKAPAAMVSRYSAVKRYASAGPSGYNRGYRRFLILGRPRSGTSLVRGMLNNHPNVVCYGEALNLRAPILRAGGLPEEGAGLELFRNNLPSKFLEDLIFRGYNSDVQAVGFKVFKEHLERFGLIAHFSKMHELYCLHLYREDFLGAYISHVRAVATNKYGLRRGEKPELTRFSLDPSACQSYFEQAESSVQWGRETYRDHPYLEITYEDICAKLPQVLESIQGFLGLPIVPLESTSRKQNMWCHQETVVNYEALSAHFKNSRWKYLFVDE